MSDNSYSPSRRGFLRLAGAGAAAVAGGPLLAACASSGSSTGSGSASGTTRLVIGMSGDPTTFDPGAASQSLANEIIKNTYAQWTKYAVTDSGQGYLSADTTKVLGEALESYTLGADNVTVTCKVRNAKFPSGQKLTSDDFIYTVKRALGEGTGPVFDFNTIGITSVSQVTKVSDTEFTMKLSEPSPILGAMLRDQDASVLDQVTLAKHATSADQWAAKWLGQDSLGGGAYTRSSYQSGSQVVLTANKNYWGTKPYFDEVVLQEVSSTDQMVLLLKEGSIDIAEGLGFDSIKQLAGASGVNLHDVPSRLQDLFGLVMTQKPFSDVRVRQAMAYAIDYDSMAKNVLHGYASAPKGTWPQNSVYFEEAWSYSLNTAKAKSLLKEAGYASGFSFTVEISNADADASSLAIALQTQLSGIGVTMNISKLSPAVFQEHLTKKSMQAWVYSGLGDYVDDPYYHLFLWLAKGANLNWFGFDNATINSLTNQLHTELDTAKRKTLAGQAQAILNEQLPYIPLTEPHFVVPARNDISGLLIEPDLLLRYDQFKRS
jgi:peptide/nickel transport system substrate-binding protein